MKKVAFKYLIRNSKNYSFYITFLIISIISIFIVLSNDLYYFKTYIQKIENSYVLATVDEEGKKVLDNNKIYFEECEPYLDTESDRCKIYFTIGNEDMITKLDDLGINYIVYTEFYDAINAKKIGKIIKVLTIVVAIGLVVLFIPMIKLKLNKESSLKRVLSYLGYTKVDIFSFDFFPICIIIPIFIILEYLIIFGVLNILDVKEFFYRNVLYITIVMIISNFILILEYLFLIIRNINKKVNLTI